MVTNYNPKSTLKTHGWQKRLCVNFNYATDKLCELYSLSKAQLARSIGFSPASFTRYCNGERTPNTEAVYLLCKQYNCSADFILGTSTSEEGESF